MFTFPLICLYFALTCWKRVSVAGRAIGAAPMAWRMQPVAGSGLLLKAWSLKDMK
jgi:hypothetical protein